MCIGKGTITHVSKFGSRDCSMFDIYTRTLFCLCAVEPRGCHTHANIARCPHVWLSVSMDAKHCMRVLLPRCRPPLLLCCHFDNVQLPSFKNVLAEVQNSAPTSPRGTLASGSWDTNEQNLDKKLSCYSGNIRDIVDVFSWAIYIIFYSICESQSLDRQSGQRCILLPPCLGQQAINAEAIWKYCWGIHSLWHNTCKGIKTTLQCKRL